MAPFDMQIKSDSTPVTLPMKAERIVDFISGALEYFDKHQPLWAKSAEKLDRDAEWQAYRLKLKRIENIHRLMDEGASLERVIGARRVGGYGLDYSMIFKTDYRIELTQKANYLQGLYDLYNACHGVCFIARGEAYEIASMQHHQQYFKRFIEMYDQANALKEEPPSEIPALPKERDIDNYKSKDEIEADKKHYEKAKKDFERLGRRRWWDIS